MNSLVNQPHPEARGGQNYPSPASLPLKNLAHVVSLTFAHDHLQRIAQRDHPTLTAKSGHLAYVVRVDNGVAVDALKLGVAQALFNRAQRLGGEQPLAGGDNPNQLSFRLESQYFVGIEQVVLFTVSADDFATRDRAQRFGRCRHFGEIIGQRYWLPQQCPRPIDGLGQPGRMYRLEEIVNRAGFESLNGMLVERRDDDDDRRRLTHEVEAVRFKLMENLYVDCKGK